MFMRIHAPPIKTAIKNKYPKLTILSFDIYKNDGLRIDISKVVAKRTKKGVIFGIWNNGMPIIESKINWI